MMQARQSNIELLRLFSMFALLFFHLHVHVLSQSVMYAEQSAFWKSLPLVLSSFTSLQVNIFILISGWFGINTTPKKILNFYFLCAFYSILTYCISIYFGSAFTIKDMVISFLPFSFLKGWWFAKAYLFLVLLAPLFNKAIEYMSKREFVYVLCAFTLINSFYGFLCQQSINPSGSNFMQLMYVYFIGRFLALHVHVDKNKLRNWSTTFCVISVTLYAVVWIINDNYLHLVNSYTFINRNNLWSMVNSVSIFLFFTTIQIDSPLINWLAKGAFAVYLMHDSIWIRHYCYNTLTSIYDTYTSRMMDGRVWLIIIAIFVVYFIGVLCFDHIRAWITNPIIKGIDRQCTKIVPNKINFKRN